MKVILNQVEFMVGDESIPLVLLLVFPEAEVGGLRRDNRRSVIVLLVVGAVLLLILQAERVVAVRHRLLESLSYWSDLLLDSNRPLLSRMPSLEVDVPRRYH